MIRIADHRLIEIADLHMDFSVGCGERPQISRVTVSADPNGRAFGNGPFAALLQPSIELSGAAAQSTVTAFTHLLNELDDETPSPAPAEELLRTALEDTWTEAS